MYIQLLWTRPHQLRAMHAHINTLARLFDTPSCMSARRRPFLLHNHPIH
jgi:hypothetical protein